MSHVDLIILAVYTLGVLQGVFMGWMLWRFHDPKGDRLEKDVAKLRDALLEANSTCRSAFQISNRIATMYSTDELGTAFGAFSEQTKKSLDMQHKVILETGGYPGVGSEGTKA